MGGLGSGRSAGGGRDTVERNRSLDVNRLHRAGYLRSGVAGGWQWTRDGERVAWIGVRGTATGVRLSYRYRRNGGDWEDVDEDVTVRWQPCRFGGQRPYFACPAIVNSR